MDPKRWKEVKSFLERSLEVPTVERPAFLDAECHDPEIRSEVESLLGFDDRDSGALETPAVNSMLPGRSSISIPPGYRIGKYQIDREIGEGGMGTVYLAHRADGEFEQKVAIKLIKGGVDLESLQRRFLNERRILASLEHPNIARLIDGGTTDDRLPYLVMEYVEGTPITDYAEAKDLNIVERLDLFRDVCAAVSVAHQNLIIHRDLKPSNILVGKDGIPKLLDFGIAKILTADESGRTQTQHFAFTPDYASPEQIRGENLTTSTDVYSLGVVLCEMLTGRRPLSFEGKGIGQIVNIASQTSPARPSTLVARAEEVKPLRGDLDNVVLKALSKDPDRRYSTVDQFAEDIRRHLKGLPVRARQDTFSYRASKFVRRNPLLAGSAALTFLILVAGIIATTYLARQAEAERIRAENRFNDVRALANSFIFEINEKIEESPIKARELLVTRAIEYLDKLTGEAEGDDGLKAELASAYEKIGDVQAELFNPSLGNPGDALRSHTKALDLREGLWRNRPTDTDIGMDFARSHLKVGDIRAIMGDVGMAAASYRNAVDLSTRLAATSPDRPEIQKQLSNSYLRLGQSVLRSGSLSECLRHYETAFEINRRLIVSSPPDADLVRRQSITYSYIGYVRVLMGDHDRAISDFRQAWEIDTALLAEQPENLKLRKNLSISNHWLGFGYREAGRITESLPFFLKALELQLQILKTDPENYGEQNSTADCYIELAVAYLAAGNINEAMRTSQEAIDRFTAVAEVDSDNFSALRQIYLSKRIKGEVLLKSGRTQDALSIFEEVRRASVDLTSKDPNNLEWKHDLAISNLRIGEIMLKLNKRDSGETALRDAHAILEGLLVMSPENVDFAADLQQVRTLLRNAQNVAAR